MKKESKRRLAFLLAFAMVISLIAPVNLQVKAAGSDTAEFQVDLKDINITSATEFNYKDAVVTHANGGTDMVTSMTVMVDKGSILTTDGAITDQGTSHKIATWVWNGGATVEDVQTKLRSINFEFVDGMEVKVIVDGNRMNLPTGDKSITSYSLGKIPDGSAEVGNTIHYYMFIEYPEDNKQDWYQAYDASKGYYFMGMQGYLVTITEPEEDKVLDEITDKGAWAGGAKIPTSLTTADLDGDNHLKDLDKTANDQSIWAWVCGPEAGIPINIKGSVAVTKKISGATEDTYQNWRRPSGDPGNQEPNDYSEEGNSGEWWLQVHFPDATHGWNDLNAKTMLSNEGGVYLSGCFVEFSEYDKGMDEDYSADKKITAVDNPKHKHDVTVETNNTNGTISVYCEEDFDSTDCDAYGEPNAKKITVKADDADYTGEPYAADTKVKLTGDQDTLDFLKDYPDADDEWTVEVTYEGRDGTTYPETATPPTDAGKYNAVVTLTAPDGTTKKSSKEPFEIKKVEITVEPKNATVAKGGTISSTPSDVTVSAGALKGDDKITAVTITGNTSDVTNSTPLVVDKDSIVIKNGDVNVTNNYKITVKNGSLKVEEAIHEWNAEPNDNEPGTIDIYCDGDPATDPDCPNAGPENAAQLTTNAPDAIYTGAPYVGATVEDEDGIIPKINSGLPADQKWTVEVTYEGRDGTTYPESVTPPTDAGKYNAIVTVTNPADPTNGTYITKKPFEIAKQDVTITPNPQEIGKGGKISSEKDDVTATGLVAGDAIDKVKITGDTSEITDNGTLTVDPASVVIKNGTKDVTGNYNIKTEAGTLKVNPANHDWKVQKDTDDPTIIDVYCNNGDPADDPGCPYVGPENAIQITTDAPNAVYTGDPYDGVTVDDDGIIDIINEDLPENKQWTIDVTYQGRNGTSYPETDKAPTDAGKYNAIITVKDSDGNKTQIKKPFEITKKDITVTPKEQNVEKGGTVASGVEYVDVTGLEKEDKVTAVTITGDTSAVTKEGTLKIDPASVVIKNGTKNVTKNYNVKTTDGKLIVPAKHSWVVTPDTEKPGTVDVYCENGDPATDPDCPYVGPENAGEIQLVAPNAPYTGKPYEGADIKDDGLLDDINDDIPADKKWTVSDTTYAGREGTEYPESSKAPTDAGKYNAIVTVKDSDGKEYKLITPFEITKQKVTITPKDQTVEIGSKVSSKPEDVEATGLSEGDKIATVAITGDTSKLTDNGTIEVTDVVIKNGDTDVTSNYDISVAEGKLKVVPAEHKWTAEPDKDKPGVVDIYYDNGGDETDPNYPYTDKDKPAQIVVDAPNATYTGTPYTDADVKGDDILDKINADLPKDKQWTISNKTYEGREGTEYPESEVPPTDAGKYNAVVTVTDSDGNKYTVKTPFEIEKCKVIVTPKDQTVANGEAVASTPNDVSAAGLVAGDAITGITITPNATNDKLEAKDAVIKNGNKDVTANYDVTYAEGKLTANQPVEPSTITFDKAGDNKQLTTPDKDTPVTWKSSDEKVAKVDPDGKVTAVADGTATITAVDPNGNVKAQYNVVVDTGKKDGVIPQPSVQEVYENETAMNAGLKVMQTKKQINVKWGQVPGANRYEIFVQYCGKNYNKKPSKVVNSAVTTSTKITKINGKKLNLKKNYKIYIVAYKVSGTQKVRLGESIRAHIVGVKNTTQTNVKQVKVKKSKFTIKQGGTAQIKAWTVLVDKTKHQLSNAHAKALRYRSDNEKVATVTAKGKIKAVGKGSCIVYVYARNGYAKQVKVTVN